MNTKHNRIDQSVYIPAGNTFNRNLGNYIPLFPISTSEKLKSALVKKFTAEYSGVATRLAYQAVNEAYALASLTPEPLLFLPALAEEKVQSAAAWAARQRSLLHPESMAFAA